MTHVCTIWENPIGTCTLWSYCIQFNWCNSFTWRDRTNI